MNAAAKKTAGKKAAGKKKRQKKATFRDAVSKIAAVAMDQGRMLFDEKKTRIVQVFEANKKKLTDHLGLTAVERENLVKKVQDWGNSFCDKTADLGTALVDVVEKEAAAIKAARTGRKQA